MIPPKNMKIIIQTYKLHHLKNYNKFPKKNYNKSIRNSKHII